MAEAGFKYTAPDIVAKFLCWKDALSFNEKAELQQLIISTDDEILREAMDKFEGMSDDKCQQNDIKILMMMIHHTRVTKDKKPYCAVQYEIPYCAVQYEIPYCALQYERPYFGVQYEERDPFFKFKYKPTSFNVKYDKEAYYNYLSLYFKGVPPSDCFRALHKVWGLYEDTEFILKLLYCYSLLQHKHYKLFTQLITENMEYFMEYEVIGSTRLPKNIYNIYVSVLLHLLSHPVKQNNTTNIARTVTTINELIDHHTQSELGYQYPFSYEKKYLSPNLLFNTDFIDEDHLTCILNPKFHFSQEVKFLLLPLCLVHCKKVINQSNYMKYKSLLRHYCLFIVSMADRLADLRVPCKMRHQYSQVLIHLLHKCASSTDTQNTELVLYGIQKLCSALFRASNSDSCRNCYCYGGNGRCRIKYVWNIFHEIKISEVEFMNYSLSKEPYEIRDNKYLEKFFKEITDKIEENIEHNCMRKTVVLQVPISVINKYNRVKANEWERESSNHDVHRVIENVLSLRSVDIHNYEHELYEIIKVICQIDMTPDVQDIMFDGLALFLDIYHHSKDHEKLATTILDIHMTVKDHLFLRRLTKYVGRVLHLNNDILEDEHRILYQLFCIVRSARRKSNDHAINIEKYFKHFSFIPKFDKEEEILKLSKLAEVVLLLPLLLSTLSSGGHHKSAKLKKYLSLKYEYDKAILYLLWCSGDVEINPGPTIKKLKPLRASEKERKWIQDMCSTLVKLAKGIPVDSKPKSLWKYKPDNWSQDQPFYDPNNKSTVCNDDDQSDERLLICLLEFCNKKGIRIPDNFQREITTWKQGNEMLLFELYVNRKKIAEILKALQNSKSYVDTLEFKRSSSEINTEIDIKVTKLLPGSTPGITHAEIVRDLALTFCRIANGLNPLEKSDGIWKKSPNGWKPENPFYSPHNAGKRREKGKDSSLVDNLLKYCEENNIAIRPKYKALADTWKLGNKEDLHKSYTVWSSIVQIEHSLKYLQLEGLLQKPAVLKELKTTGLTLDAQAWNLNLDTKATPAKSGFENKPTNLQNFKLATHKIEPLREKDQHQQKQNSGKILSQNHLEDQLSPLCSDNDFNHCISLPSTSGTTTKTSNNYLTLKRPDNVGKDTDFQCHPSEKSSEKEKKLNKNVSTDNPDIQHNTSTDCSSERDGNHTYPPINTKDLENGSTSLPDSTTTKNNLQTDDSLNVNKKRKCKYNSRSHGKRFILSVTSDHLPESNANHPRPEDIHHSTCTKQQTTPNLDQYDGIIVSLVDQLSNLTENDSINNNHGLRPVDLNHSTIQQTDANLNQITSVIDSEMDLMSPDCIAVSDEEDNDSVDDIIDGQTDKLPEEILTSYIGDYINCNNPEEKLHKDMDL